MAADGAPYPAIRYTRRRDLGRVVLAAEVAPANVDFSAPGAARQISATDLGDGFDEVIVRSDTPLSVAPRQFLRLRATLP